MSSRTEKELARALERGSRLTDDLKKRRLALQAARASAKSDDAFNRMISGELSVVTAGEIMEAAAFEIEDALGELGHAKASPESRKQGALAMLVDALQLQTGEHQ